MSIVQKGHFKVKWNEKECKKNKWPCPWCGSSISHIWIFADSTHAIDGERCGPICVSCALNTKMLDFFSKDVCIALVEVALLNGKYRSCHLI